MTVNTACYFVINAFGLDYKIFQDSINSFTYRFQFLLDFVKDDLRFEVSGTHDC